MKIQDRAHNNPVSQDENRITMDKICCNSLDVNPSIAGFSAEIHAGLDGNPDLLYACLQYI